MRTLQNQIGWCARAQWTLSSAMVLFAVAFFLFGYRPATVRLAELRAQVEAKQRELQSNQTKTEIRATVEQNVAKLRRQLDRSDKQLPRHQDWGQFMHDITKLRQQFPLDQWLVEPAAQPRQNALFVELPIDMRFEGDFLSVFGFLRQVDQMPRLTRVQDLKVRAKPGKAGKVEVQLLLNIYYSEG